MAVSDFTCEVLWIRLLLEDLGIKSPIAIPVFTDNQGCICLTKNPGHRARTKHISVAIILCAKNRKMELSASSTFLLQINQWT
jgi:hypothetical protein